MNLEQEIMGEKNEEKIELKREEKTQQTVQENEHNYFVIKNKEIVLFSVHLCASMKPWADIIWTLVSCVWRESESCKGHERERI